MNNVLAAYTKTVPFRDISIGCDFACDAQLWVKVGVACAVNVWTAGAIYEPEQYPDSPGIFQAHEPCMLD